MDILDPELRRQLSLTTADLRFADYLVRCVTEDSGDVFLDDTGTSMLSIVVMGPLLNVGHYCGKGVAWEN